MVDVSPWPLLASIGSVSLVLSALAFLWGKSSWELICFMTAVIGLVAFQWWRDVVRESTFCGTHTISVCSGLYFGFILFILSEVMFFFSFFFGFFSVSLSPDVGLGCSWPPCGVIPLSYFSVPLFNTLLLLSSGVSITWTHHSLTASKLREAVLSLCVTVCLGVLFLFVQINEYFEACFCIQDSVFGSFFFLITGFHGFHVLVGLMFIGVTLLRILSNHFSYSHITGFEVCAWYWHFVDVVWLFLFVSVYWWGS